jgi:hypothetical protein
MVKMEQQQTLQETFIQQKAVIKTQLSYNKYIPLLYDSCVFMTAFC